MEGEPGAPQLGVVGQRVLEAPERAAAHDRPLEQVARACVAHVADEVLHVAVADRDGQRLNHHHVRVLGVLPERGRAGDEVRLDRAGQPVDVPDVLVRMVLERKGEIGEIDRLRVEHRNVLFLW